MIENFILMLKSEGWKKEAIEEARRIINRKEIKEDEKIVILSEKVRKCV